MGSGDERTLLLLVGVTGSRCSLEMLTTFSLSFRYTEHIPPCGGGRGEQRIGVKVCYSPVTAPHAVPPWAHRDAADHPGLSHCLAIQIGVPDLHLDVSGHPVAGALLDA